MPKVSLIISNFNGEDMLRECLDSLTKLDYPSYEIIVVDAASTDGTPNMIRKEFPGVILIEGKGKLGLGEAINIGLARSTGEIIGFDLNNDEVFSKCWLRSIVDELISTKQKEVVGGMRLRYSDPGVVDSVGAKISFYGLENHFDLGKRVSEISLKTQQVDYVGCPVFHANILDKMSLFPGSRKVFDEKYYFYFEDSDFCEMARRLGYKIITLYSAISYHRGGSTVVSESAKSYYYNNRNRLRFFIKHFSTYRMFIAMSWWLYKISTDTIKAFPLTEKLLIYLGFRKFRYIGRINAIINVVCWNLINMKDHFKARAINKELLRRAR